MSQLRAADGARLARVARWARTRMHGAVLALLALSGAAAADAQPVAADRAPQAWIAYAQRVSQQLQTALASDDSRAQRFRAFFERWVQTYGGTIPVNAEAPPPDHPLPPPPTLLVLVWLDRSGAVNRVGFDTLGDDEAVANLESLLLAQKVGAAPPRGMKQPVMVRLGLGAQL